MNPKKRTKVGRGRPSIPLEALMMVCFLLPMSSIAKKSAPSPSVIGWLQQAGIAGKVVNEAGEALQGVTVRVAGTSRVAITDAEGAFLMEAASGDMLEFSLVGYEPFSQTVGEQKQLAVTLQLAENQLDEVVVVGYGTQRKANLTGSVSAVSATDIAKRSVASLSTALQGTMPGVTIQQTSGQPGADGSNIRIRGIGSINSTTFPLVLVDGIEMSIDQVDINTVESISVLKDAASASIYGSRASNGVILITTKRGTAGKISTTYNGYTTLQQPTNMPEAVDAWEYLDAELKAWDNAGISVSPTQREQQLKLIEDQKNLRPDNWNRYDTDWRDATMKDVSLLQKHSLSIQGGTERIRFFGAGSYLHQDGLIPNNSYKRVNFRVNADAQLAPWARLALNTNLRQSTTKAPGVSTPKSIINKALYMLPTLSAAKELDGHWGYGKNGDNPAAQANDSGEQLDKNSEVLLNGTLTLTPLEGLELVGQYSYRNVTLRDRSLILPYTVSLKGAVMGMYPSQDNLQEGWQETIRNFYRFQGSYEKQHGQHYAKILAGFQAEDSHFSSFFGSKRGFELGRYYLGNGDGATATSGGGANSWAMMSGYGRINYNFAEKYLLEVNGRYDGSSRFITKNRWGFFPSVSAGWVVSAEDFMEATSNYLDMLKIRVSYGVLGNQDIGNYPYTATVNPGYGYYLGDNKELASGVAQTALANANILWEKSKQFDVGVDVNLWNDKLSVTADYYVKSIYDMLLKFPLPYYAGMQPAFSNAGDMENRGWEISIGHKGRINEFRYGVTLSLNDNQNEITNLNGLTTQDRSMVEGYPNNGVWGYLTDGYYTDWDDVASSPALSKSVRPGYVKYKKIYEGEGVDPMVIDSRDLVYLGDPFPHMEYGLTLNASWRQFDFTAFIQGVGKRSAFLSGIGLKPFANGANLFRHQLDYWSEDNPNADYPILVPEANSADNFVRSDKWVRDASYGRLKNVMLGYTLNNPFTKRMGVGSIRLYVSGQNLITLSNFYKGYDPEVSYGGSLGGEFYPIMKTYTFGLDLKF
ncbi:SusC/RagA family TonB-linked outer membrane protein [Parapedobacter soli]|uniref:SusC/RagA family TonB-linked outer membrane protein n=1 Tax=Parapedobacter soli TaxID=416955 RepID=UPI0021C78575|nr:TonB-dependent receptor [Parapedobacter soli]